MTLTTEQQAAYDAALKHKTLFISGGAGTGKSVVVTELMRNDDSNKFVVCATTNQAARVLSEKLNTGHKVPTLHSVLKLQPDYDGSTKESKKIMSFKPTLYPKEMVHLKGKTLIIDEASMICRHIQDYIFDILDNGNLEGVIFVGDRYQLPCVAEEPFDYSRIEQVIELLQVMRSSGTLMDYYSQIRSDVIADRELSLFSEAVFFDSKKEFVAYMNRYEGSKAVISWRNATAKSFSALLDSDQPYVGQECSALSHCSYQHYESCQTVGVTTNSPISIDKLFGNHRQMKRDAMKNGYEFRLPNEPVEIEVSDITYARVYNEDNDIVYVSIWNGQADDKERLYLNKMNRGYRKLQDSLRSRINNNALWNTYAKSDGYLKSLKPLKGRVPIPRHFLDADRLFWNNFFAITQAVLLRSRVSTTAHRAQGITVDVAGVDIQDLTASTDKRLQYVALTRAAKQLVIYTGGSHESAA